MRSGAGSWAVWLATLAACELFVERPPAPAPRVEPMRVEPAPAEARPEEAPEQPQRRRLPEMPAIDPAWATTATRADSLAAAPHWARGEVDELAAEERARLFAAAGAEAQELGAVAGAVLCAATVRRRVDNQGMFAAPDLTAIVTVGDGPRIEVRGEEDRTTIVAAVVMAALKPGDAIRVRVIDRDFWSDTGLGTISGKYAGVSPWTGQSGLLAVECRVLAGAALERELATQLAAVDAMLTREEVDVRFASDEDDLGLFASGLVGNRLALSRLAALFGWGHPEVRRRVAWEAEIEAPLFEAGREFVRRQLERLPPATESVAIVPGLFDGRVDGIWCGPGTERRVLRSLESSDRGHIAAHGGCVVRLVVAAVGDMALDAGWISTRGISTPRAVLANGEAVKLRVLALEGVRSKWEDDVLPGKSATLLMIPEGKFELATEPAAVMVMTGREESAQAVGPPVFLRAP